MREWIRNNVLSSDTAGLRTLHRMESRQFTMEEVLETCAINE